MKSNSIFRLFVIMLTMLSLPLIVVQGATGLKVGVAKVKITPEESTILGGYTHGAASNCNPATDILDDIYCRVLVAEDGYGNREVFLSMDVCVYMESDYYDPSNGVGVWWPRTVPSGTTQRFANAGNVSLNNVFVSATHTHQASEQLAEKYIQRIINGINTARNNMIFVNVGYANTTYDINVNRRPDYGVHLALECDKSLVVAIFSNAYTNAPVASMVNYSIHNTGIGVGGNGFHKCSSELTGIAMNKIESTYGGNFVSLFFQGFGADVGPNCNGSNGADYSRIVAMGNAFGQDCTNVLNGISLSSNPIIVKGTRSFQNLATRPGWGVLSQEVHFKAARIGDICFVGGSGEIFNQMGISLRLQSPFGAVMTCSLLNGYSGYVPTFSAFYDGVGGAEVYTKNPWNSDIENTYMTEMSKLVSVLTGGSSILGYSRIGRNSESSIANNLIISKYNAGATMTLNSLKIYVQNATGKVRMGLYSDIGLDRPSLVQQTGEITLANGWNEGAIPSTIIGPGTYWIGFVFSNSGNVIYFENRKLGSYSQSLAFGSLPSRPSGMKWGAGIYSLYSGNDGTMVQVNGVNLSPTSASISIGASQQLTATVSPSNASNKTVSWSSSNPSVATVSSLGLVTGVGVGSATITVTTQDGNKTATCVITVGSENVSTIGLTTIGNISESGDNGFWIANSFTAVSNMTVNRINLYVTYASGTARLGIYSNNSGEPGTLLTQTGEVPLVNGWNSENLGSDLNLSQGVTYWLAFEVSSPATTIQYNTALGRLKYKSFAYGPLPSSAPLNCSAGTGIYSIYADNNGNVSPVLVSGVNLSPTSASLSIGTSQQLTATVSPSNASNKTVNWSSSNPSVATVSSLGLVTGVGVGSATITVTTQEGAKTATCAITVSNPSIMVSSVGLSSTSASISIGASQQLTATVSPSNASNKNVSWSSNNPSVATINSLGLVTGVGVGSATITVTTQEGDKTATCVITVGSENVSTIGLTTIGNISESGDSGFWIANSFTAVSNMTVNRINLYVTYASGTARLGIYSNNSGEPGTLLTQTGEVPLVNGWNSGNLGSAQNLTQGVTYWLAFEVNSPATTIQYNTALGRLKYKPYAYGPLPSSAPLNCSAGTGIYSIYADNSGNASPVLVSGVNLSPTSASISIGASQQLTATVSPSNASNKNINWSSSNPSVATVSSLGLVTGVGVGSATITVTTQEGAKTATCAITVGSENASTIGLTTIGNISESGDSGFWIANSFTAVSNMTVNRINLYVTYASGTARLGIYSSISGEPGTLLAQTGEKPLANGWNSENLGSDLNLSQGVTYWLAFEVSSPATTIQYNTALGRLKYKQSAYGPLPSSAPLNCMAGTGIYSIFADKNDNTTPNLASVVYIEGGLKNAALNENSIETFSENYNQNQLMVFPNPVTNGMLYINLFSDTEGAAIKITDMTGRVICNKTYQIQSGLQELDIRDLNSGLYLVNITQGKASFNCKLIVKR